METNEQIELIKSLRSIQKIVLRTFDKEKVILKVKEAMTLALPVAPYVNDRLKNASYKFQSKGRSLRLLFGDLSCIERGVYYDWETIHFQVATSLAMLMIVYADGGISRCLEIAN